jgi:transcriptional regulator with XRE-family HTH domain
MTNFHTPNELEASLGENLKRLRLNKNIDQKSLAAQAGLSLRALKNLENGQGSTLKSLVTVVRALGREDWLGSIAPIASINPLSLVRTATPRQRARTKLRFPAKVPTPGPSL